MYKSFKVSNMWRTFQWMLFSNRRQLTIFFIGIIIATFVGGELSFMSYLYVSDANIPNRMPNDSGSFFFAFLGLAWGLWMLYGASQLFDFMKHKQSAITYLMHPATMLEKFVARLIYVSLLWAVIGGVGIFIGDFLSWGINTLFFDNNGTMAVVYFWKNVFVPLGHLIFNYQDFYFVLFLTNVMFFWIYTLYLLGSAVFRRHRLLLTTACVVFIMVSLTISDVIEDDMAGVATLIFLMLSVANIVGSYMLFKRMQVINNKWLNI